MQGGPACVALCASHLDHFDRWFARALVHVRVRVKAQLSLGPQLRRARRERRGGLLAHLGLPLLKHRAAKRAAAARPAHVAARWRLGVRSHARAFASARSPCLGRRWALLLYTRKYDKRKVFLIEKIRKVSAPSIG